MPGLTEGARIRVLTTRDELHRGHFVRMDEAWFVLTTDRRRVQLFIPQRLIVAVWVEDAKRDETPPAAWGVR